MFRVKTDKYLVHEIKKKTKFTKEISINSKIHFEAVVGGVYQTSFALNFQLFVDNQPTNTFISQGKLDLLLKEALKVQNLSQISIKDKEFFSFGKEVEGTSDLLKEVTNNHTNLSSSLSFQQEFSSKKGFKDFLLTYKDSEKFYLGVLYTYEFIEEIDEKFFLITIEIEKSQKQFGSNNFESAFIKKIEFSC